MAEIWLRRRRRPIFLYNEGRLLRAHGGGEGGERKAVVAKEIICRRLEESSFLASPHGLSIGACHAF